MFRVLKPGGFVYAEIPFLRSYHMAPIDYQRYTISGIHQLFSRHGFLEIDKGVCSGPFTAFTLFARDFVGSAVAFNKYLRAALMLPTSLLLHPFKYLDRLCESSSWAHVFACNFYYSGRKMAAAG